MDLGRIARLRRPAARVGDPAASDLGGAKAIASGGRCQAPVTRNATAAVARTQRVPGAFGCARIVGFRALSVAWSNVLFIEPISDIEHATAVVGSVCAGLDAIALAARTRAAASPGEIHDRCRSNAAVDTGRTADPPATRTACSSALTIIGCSMKVTGRSGSPPTVSPNTSPRHGSTRTAHHDAT